MTRRTTPCFNRAGGNRTASSRTTESGHRRMRAENCRITFPLDFSSKARVDEVFQNSPRKTVPPECPQISERSHPKGVGAARLLRASEAILEGERGMWESCAIKSPAFLVPIFRPSLHLEPEVKKKAARKRAARFRCPWGRRLTQMSKGPAYRLPLAATSTLSRFSSR